jgi:hypothetical protein
MSLREILWVLLMAVILAGAGCLAFYLTMWLLTRWGAHQRALDAGAAQDRS